MNAAGFVHLYHQTKGGFLFSSRRVTADS